MQGLSDLDGDGDKDVLYQTGNPASGALGALQFAGTAKGIAAAMEGKKAEVVDASAAG